MRSSQVTIKDIAKELGISPSTVSRALKDHPNINIKTKKAVQELAKKLNYRPNAVALSLLQSKSNIIGLIIPEVVHHFFSTVISGIEDYALDKGYNVMMYQSNESYEREVSNTQAILANRIDGLLVSISKETKDYAHLNRLIESGIPIVLFDRSVEEIHADRVIINDFEGAYMATEHLIEQGCKRISHLAGPQSRLIGKKRLAGYRQALIDHRLPVYEDLVIDCDTYEAALEQMPKLLNSSIKPDGVFAVNDMTAIGAMKIIKMYGMKIPKDIAVVGFGNDFEGRILETGLSSIEQKGYEMGEAAVELLIERLKIGGRKEAETKILKSNLIIRDSSKRIKE